MPGCKGKDRMHLLDEIDDEIHNFTEYGDWEWEEYYDEKGKNENLHKPLSLDFETLLHREDKEVERADECEYYIDTKDPRLDSSYSMKDSRVDAHESTSTSQSHISDTSSLVDNKSKNENETYNNTPREATSKAKIQVYLSPHQQMLQDNTKSLRQLLSSTCPDLYFSRLSSRMGGSIRIICEKNRTAWLLLWSTSASEQPRSVDDSATLQETGDATSEICFHRYDMIKNAFFVKAVPIVNCSPHSNQMMMEVANTELEPFISSFLTEHGSNDESNSPGNISLFNSLTNFIVKEKLNITTGITRRVNDLHLTEQGNDVTRSNPILKSLKTNSIIPGVSLDYLDIYQDTETKEIEMIQKVDEKHVICHHTEPDSHQKDEDSVCPICFDDFENNDVAIESCGHTVCISCWRGLLRSAASSGDAVISCPSFRCSNILSIRDIAHLLFDFETPGTNPITQQRDIQIFISLMRYRMERHLLEMTTSDRSDKTCQRCNDDETEVLTGFRFCPTPSCGRVFPASQKKIDDGYASGADIMICVCNASMCKSCNQPSHLGMDCEAYRKIRKEVDSGRLDGELKSLTWMKDNTQPCPKCQFPINKNGGCNHVSCGKCNYYFCWHCGGPGTSCMAYLCRNAKRSIHTENENHSSSFQLPEQVRAIMDYSKAEWEYESTMRKKGQALLNDESSFEIQIRTVIMWAHNLILQAFLSSKCKKKVMKLWKVTVPNLELIIQTIQKVNMKHETKISRVSDSNKSDEGKSSVTPSLIDMTTDAKVSIASKKRALTTRQQQKRDAISKKRDSGIMSMTETLLSENIGLATLLTSLSPKQLRKQASLLIRQIIEQLVVFSRPTARISKATKQHKLRLLNERKTTIKASWKNKSDRRDKGEDKDDNAKERGDNLTDRRISKWKKGKSRTKQMRSHQLSQRDFN